ncbi:hypothetical protein MUK71_03695 [Arthrobacter zhangbolii]|uniref:IrrE N-terminal-like domain-containing protein n=1 Tax=Arthrobacter zhangbolii TaxID=2886936 RepID=A0A9X1M941_9MICC|nr:hypothetical protein [Arthrobacter zhangbolii]MCC3273256.1 hypothetical protein [Arthrobacter zhangbolii]MCC3295879.1 hypothetical protein [Arthrobacter zhangbolii]UON92760.1 hypothetical protein MUK71_03695 [Arthrobacter zhangbolii]
MRFGKSAGERATSKAVVDALNLGEHVTFDDLLAAVTKTHGKPIELRDIDSAVIPSVTGLWIEKDKKSIILLPSGDNKLHRTHAACHEFGHILLRHQGCGGVETTMPSLFQHIGSRKGIRRMLARSLTWNATERAAEQVAYLLSLALLPKEPESPSSFERTFL